MSITDRVSMAAETTAQMTDIGRSLAATLYSSSKTICLSGELGIGKTTFVQGFARGLGIEASITSPSYALEQRYGHALAHLDLYRLSSAQADEFLSSTEDFSGIRCIEWSNRANGVRADIDISINENDGGKREIAVVFKDVAIPVDALIYAWIEEVHVPAHIRKHMEVVASAATKIADHLRTERRMIVRTAALRAAALLHDLLRFVDFPSCGGDRYYTPTIVERRTWTMLKERYGQPHEHAAATYLQERGYPDLAEIVRTHRGFGRMNDREIALNTVEQKVLAYADKRTRFDQIVSVDERFDDFVERYGSGTETSQCKEWRKTIKNLEMELFGRNVPLLS